MQIAQEPRHQPDASANLQVRIVEKHFLANGATLPVLRDLHFDVKEGEFLTLLGPSGSGKTTLLRMIAGLDTAYEGTISLGVKRLTRPGPERGIVFQESRLLPWLSVERNIAFALPSTTAPHELHRRVDHALALVGLTQFRETWPFQLSGGMEKRVALARALVNVPKLLLLDEPFGALDALSKFSMQDELARLHQDEKLTTVLVTHDVDEAVYLSDRVALLTPCPATIANVHAIPLPRPRIRTSEPFERLRLEILDQVLHQK